MRLGLGREKIFQVRALYNDVTFIDEFLTPEFVIDQKMYSFGFSGRNDRYEIESREFKEVKEKMLFQLTNFGDPYIRVVDANHANRGELLLEHQHAGMDLRGDYAKETLSALVRAVEAPRARRDQGGQQGRAPPLRRQGPLDGALQGLMRRQRAKGAAGQGRRRSWSSCAFCPFASAFSPPAVRRPLPPPPRRRPRP